MIKPKKIPERMCVACREKKPKQQLVRIVHSKEDDAVTLDTTGKKNGRGAYICHTDACLRRAQKSRALQRALDVPISDELYDLLAAQLVSQPQQAAVQPGQDGDHAG